MNGMTIKRKYGRDTFELNRKHGAEAVVQAIETKYDHITTFEEFLSVASEIIKQMNRSIIEAQRSTEEPIFWLPYSNDGRDVDGILYVPIEPVIQGGIEAIELGSEVKGFHDELAEIYETHDNSESFVMMIRGAPGYFLLNVDLDSMIQAQPGSSN